MTTMHQQQVTDAASLTPTYKVQSQNCCELCQWQPGMVLQSSTAAHNSS
jgi:hypothetical protein